MCRIREAGTRGCCSRRDLHAARVGDPETSARIRFYVLCTEYIFLLGLSISRAHTARGYTINFGMYLPVNKFVRGGSAWVISLELEPANSYAGRTVYTYYSENKTERESRLLFGRGS